mgnify:FL=1|tara:strand:- start:237 stop:857 length:621 start_codon:yes stop_codon:yes gene_type:complete
MSLIGKIDDVPLYSTVAEAVTFASQFGLTGYHEHTLKGVRGYMGGVDHRDITLAMESGIVNFLSKSAHARGKYITNLSIRNQYIAHYASLSTVTPTPRQLALAKSAASTTPQFAPPPPPPQFPGGTVYYGTYSATYRVPADPDLYPGGANEILVFDNQGNLFNVAWPGDTQYNALKQAYINQATNGNTTGFANGVTVTNIPAIGTY